MIAALALLALGAAAQTPPPAPRFDAPEVSTAEATDVYATTAPPSAVALEDVVAAAVVQRLTYLATVQTARSAAGSLLNQRGLYDPTLSLSASNSDQKSTLVAVPNSVPPQTDNRNPKFDGNIAQNLYTGGQLTFDVNDNGQQVFPFPTLHQAAATLTLTHPLLKGAGPSAANAAIDAAYAALQGAQASARRALDQAVADAENAYWALAQTEAQEDAARLSMNAGDVLVLRNRELEKRRLIAAYDVLTAEAGAAQRRANYVEAVRVRRDAMEALVFVAWGAEAARLFKAGAYEIRTTSAAPAAPALPSPPEAEGVALDTREDLKAARYGLRQAEITLVQLRNALLPELNASASIGGTGNYQTGDQGARWDAVSRALSGKDPSWSLGLSFLFPVLKSADRGNFQVGQAAVETQRLNVIAYENQVRQDVRGAIRAVRFERARRDLARREVALFERQLDGEKRRLDLGLSDSFRLLQVEGDTTQARLDLANAQLAFAQAVTAYRLAMGQSVDPYRTP